MKLGADSKADRVEAHIRGFFAGHKIHAETWSAGPIMSTVPEFRCIVAAPGPKLDLWAYTSVGGVTVSEPGQSHLEFTILAQRPSDRFVELIAMAVFYHRNNMLGLGHTVPIGEPWIGKSKCDHYLVSLPYPLGPEFEMCNFKQDHAHIFWLLPITSRERDYKAANGLEALEQKFDDVAFKYWDMNRRSVV